jgi:hypothetical protein
MSNFCRIGVALLGMVAALPAVADTQFRVRRMTRNDVPLGKGQCDIRLQVDQEVEVAVRGDVVSIRTLAGRDARDDGSECNEPMPGGNLQGFNYEVKDSRGDIRLIDEPSRRNGYAAIVRIRDSSGGEGRYHFRLTWVIGGFRQEIPPPPPPRREPDYPGERRGGFLWNDTMAYRGEGRGTVTYDGSPQRLFGVVLDIDRRGRIVLSFRMEGGRTLAFSGTVVGQEGERLRAEVVTDDRFRLRGMMFLSVNDRRNTVNSVTVNAGDGRGDRLRVTWDRR